ncbi:CBO0543 family protein [Paenibacillus whitsoniae]|uniref:Uncharacterized protein n=1 Tax=Paenibacillus whitsoniae TaxID=2496558 RepID=A0A3S0CDG8_9BACL|nr:CBO0543 family protein [Paenibacillus whitsoniae]RTE11461.1 hypothetical protein EJQ19_01965 [Paenibacillus whitsoniae]
MILFSNIIFLFTAMVTGSLKAWRRYYQTALYLSYCNLLYNLLCNEYLLWEYHPDWLLNHIVTDLINSIVLLPAAAMLYLHHFPEKGNIKTVLYYLAWIAGFSVLEFFWHLNGVITYDHGWKFPYSIIFYFAMFFAIRLHHRSAGKALLFSLAAVTFLLIVFKVPLWKQ